MSNLLAFAFLQSLAYACFDAPPVQVGGSQAVQDVEMTRAVVGLSGDLPLSQSAFAQAVGPQVADLNYRVETVELAAMGPLETFAWARTTNAATKGPVFWLEPLAPGSTRVRLFLAIGAPQARVYVRELELAGGEMVAGETLAIVLRTQLQAIASDLAPSMQEVEVPPGAQSDVVSEVEPQAESTAVVDSKPVGQVPASDIRFEIGMFADALAKQLPVQAGGAIALHVRGRSGVFVAIGLGMLATPTTHAVERIRLVRLPISVRSGYEWDIPSKKLRIDLGLGLTPEWVHWALAESSNQSTQGIPGASWRIAVGPSVGLFRRIWGGLGVRIQASGEVWLLNWALKSREMDRNTTLVYPYAASASIFAGLAHVF